jgi:hypothetical protein
MIKGSLNNINNKTNIKLINKQVPVITRFKSFHSYRFIYAMNNNYCALECIYPSYQAPPLTSVTAPLLDISITISRPPIKKYF